MNRLYGLIAFALATALLASGCSTSGDSRRSGTSSSLVEFLYPDGEVPPRHDTQVPHLRLPLRVGLAFVPETRNSGYRDAALPEALKMQALEQVRAAFAERPYVREIVIVPDAYLRHGPGGFQTLEQLGRLYGLDVLALVSFDQVSAASERQSSLLYWTLVGAYVVKGNRNGVSTFVDTAVFDVSTRKLLLRAPGLDQAGANSTIVEAGRVMRETRDASFVRAMDDMSANLDRELEAFHTRLREQPQSVRVSGRLRDGGSPAWTLLLTLFAAAASRRYRET
jgi:rhombotail lipoprotein